MPAQHAVHFQQGTPQRAAEDVGQAHAQQEVTCGAGTLFTVEPVGQVQHHAGEQARFGDPEQQAHDVERGFALDEGHARREQAPGDHDAGDPEACAHPMHDQVAGYFGQGVGEEEQAGAQAVGRCRQAEVDAHAGLGQGNVGPVKEAHHVDNDEQWHQFAQQQAVQALFGGGGRGGRRCSTGEDCHCFFPVKSAGGVPRKGGTPR
ncbi:hypothetical protein D3C81_1261640 [compost metagenome]